MTWSSEPGVVVQVRVGGEQGGGPLQRVDRAAQELGLGARHHPQV